MKKKTSERTNFILMLRWFHRHIFFIITLPVLILLKISIMGQSISSASCGPLLAIDLNWSTNFRSQVIFHHRVLEGHLHCTYNHRTPLKNSSAPTSISPSSAMACDCNFSLRTGYKNVKLYTNNLFHI